MAAIAAAAALQSVSRFAFGERVMHKKIITSLFLLSACVGASFAAEEKSASDAKSTEGEKSAEAKSGADSKLGFRSGGYVFWENYRLGSADYNGSIHKGDWFNSILG